MEINDSVLIAKLTDEFNMQLAAGLISTDANLDDFLYKCITSDAENLWPDWTIWTEKQTSRTRNQRIRDDAKTSRHIMKRYASAFRAFDDALSAAEFVNHSLLSSCIPSDNDETPSPVLGPSGHLGGIATRNLILIGMHARMIATATEISSLLKWGFAEGAASRCRTIHEIVVKSIIITNDKSSHGVELAERYYVSGILERKRSGMRLGEEEEDLLANARRKWGAALFRGEHNWALPAMPSSFRGDRVSFSDLERAVEGQGLRHIYLKGNAATHAGAEHVISDLDFRRPTPFTTGPKIDIYMTGYIGQSSAFYLEMGTGMISTYLATRMKEWDALLHAIDFFRKISVTNKHFREVYTRQARSESGINENSP